MPMTIPIIPGYAAIEQSPHGSRRRVLLGIRRADGHPVALKLYRASAPSPKAALEAQRRAIHELEILRRIRSDRVPRPLETCAFGEGHVLVLERVVGQPLSVAPKARGLSTADLLEIALGAARALADVHASRVIHQGIEPDNLIFDFERKRISLVGLGSAAEFGRAQQTLGGDGAAGALAYRAPEQTGRTARGIDFRTDLYSLGATFYELLTGKPPFAREQGCDLVLAHLALTPRPACELESSAPIGLSRIASKLLEKDPELRYQTAHGLVSDLESCQKQYQATGEIDPEIELGVSDASDRLRFPNRIYGRKRERAELVARLERAARGEAQCILVCGPPGIGKTSLVNELREPLARMGGIFAETKFEEERRERPYSGLASALARVVDQLLTSSEVELTSWSERIRSQVGGVVGVLVELIPQLDLLIEDPPAIPKLGALEERERLCLATARFVRALAHPHHPLVLFLDDLQWADEGSVKVVESLLRNATTEALVIVGGYRDDEGSLDQPLVRALRERLACEDRVCAIEMGSIDLDATTALLADALARAPHETAWLAQLIGLKCAYNPFLMRRMLMHLWDCDLLRYEHAAGWVWDEQRIRETEISDDVAEVLAARIDRLTSPARELLEAASLLGNVFECDLVATLARQAPSEAHGHLIALAEEGWVAPCREGFKFLHDRIREAAKRGLSLEQHERLHLEAARILVERTAAAEDPDLDFRRAEHLSHAISRLEPAERWPAIEVFHRIGKQSLGKGAGDTAARHLNLARRLLCESDWTEHAEVAFSVHLAAAEASLQQRAFTSALGQLSELSERALTRLELGRVFALRILVMSLRGDPDPEAQVIRAMTDLGIRWPRDPSKVRMWIEIAWTDWKLARLLRDEKPPPPVPPHRDLAWLAPVLVVGAAAPRLSLCSGRLTCLGWALTLRSFVSHSASFASATALAGYAGMSIAVLQNPSSARRYATAVESWIHHAKDPVEAMRARMVFEMLIRSWLCPRRDLTDRLMHVARDAEELGDHQFISFSLHGLVSMAALSGEALPRVCERLDGILQRGIGARQDTARAMLQAYDLLRVACASDTEWNRRCGTLVELSLDAQSGEDFYSMMHVAPALCLAGSFAHALDVLERLWPSFMRNGAIGSRLADLFFYRGLSHAGSTPETAGRREKRHVRRVLHQSLRKLRTFARHNSDFTHMVFLLEAELARLRNDVARAVRRYHLGAQSAQAVGYIQHAALANERVADLLTATHHVVESDRVRSSAIQLYRAWGAMGKAAQLGGS